MGRYFTHQSFTFRLRNVFAGASVRVRRKAPPRLAWEDSPHPFFVHMHTCTASPTQDGHGLGGGGKSVRSIGAGAAAFKNKRYFAMT